jgi:putative flippase GtrA
MTRAPRTVLFGELFKYGIASAVAFVVDFTTLVILTEILGLHYLTGAAVGFAAGIAVAYVLSIRWVFARRSTPNAARESALFLFIGIAGLGLNLLLMWTTTDMFGLHYQLSKLLSTGVVFLFNFGLRKLLLFTVPATTGAYR